MRLSKQREDHGRNDCWRKDYKFEGLVLWIVVVKVRKKMFIRKMKRARGIISHPILYTRNLVMSRHIAVNSLVDSMEAEKVSRGFVGRSATLSLPKHCRKIVRLVINGTFPDVVRLDCSLEVEKSSSEF